MAVHWLGLACIGEEEFYLVWMSVVSNHGKVCFEIPNNGVRGMVDSTATSERPKVDIKMLCEHPLSSLHA